MQKFITPMLAVVLTINICCSKKTDFHEEPAKDDTVAQVNTPTESEPKEGEATSHQRPTGGVWVYQGIWLSSEFEEEFKRTKSIEKGQLVDPSPVLYIDFSGPDGSLSLFEFSNFLANIQPTQVFDFSSYESNEIEKHMTVDIGKSAENKQGITKLEVVRKNDYDNDKDGEVDDLETLTVNFYKGTDLIITREYYKTYRSLTKLSTR